MSTVEPAVVDAGMSEVDNEDMTLLWNGIGSSLPGYNFTYSSWLTTCRVEEVPTICRPAMLILKDICSCSYRMTEGTG